jgi:hypothetical protein
MKIISGARYGLLITWAAWVDAGAPARAQDVDLLPLLEVSRGEARNEPYFSPVGGYVRFFVERVSPETQTGPSPESIERYSRERRNWLNRLFTGRNRTHVLNARLEVNRADVITHTVTLASTSHSSNRRQGENWTSEIGDRRFLTPYFRVDAGTTAAVEVSLSASRSVDSDITQNVLAIVERGARLAAPTSPLVTSLTSQRLTDTANFVDNSISRLFGEALVERAQSDFAAEHWYQAGTTAATPSLVQINAWFPMGGHIWSTDRVRQIGGWSVRVSEPIVSIFSTVPLYARAGDPSDDRRRQRCAQMSSQTTPRAEGKGGQEPQQTPPVPLEGQDLQACIAFSGLVPSRVLGLAVGENVTLGQALRGDAAITAAIQRFDSNGKTPGGAREICILIAERADALGLNSYDAAAALWAFAANGGVSVDAANLMKEVDTDCTTAQLAMHLGLTITTRVSADQGDEAPASGVPAPNTGTPIPPTPGVQESPPTAPANPDEEHEAPAMDPDGG